MNTLLLERNIFEWIVNIVFQWNLRKTLLIQCFNFSGKIMNFLLWWTRTTSCIYNYEIKKILLLICCYVQWEIIALHLLTLFVFNTSCIKKWVILVIRQVIFKFFNKTWALYNVIAEIARTYLQITVATKSYYLKQLKKYIGSQA